MPNIERIDSPDLAPPTGYSHVVRSGNTAWIAGAAGMDVDGNIVGMDDPEAQIEQTFQNLRTALATVDADLSNVVKWTVYLTDAAYIPAWRNVRSKHVTDDIRPAGTLLIIAGLARAGMIVEIEAVALLD